MLILQRKTSESLVINGNVTITIQEITADRVKIAIDAPREISIVRSELLEAASANKAAVQEVADLSPIASLTELIQQKKEESKPLVN